MRQYAAVHDLLEKSGRKLQVAWWGQKNKTDGDIDEISPDLFIAHIAWDEFVAIAIPALEASGEKAEFLAAPPAAANEDGGEAGGRKTSADKAIDLARSATYFSTPNKVAYADVLIDGNRHTYAVRSRVYRLWLTSQYLKEYGKGLGSQAVQDALATIEAIATFQGETHEVYLRTAEYLDKIYIDLGTGDWRVIEVDANGWRIMSEPPVRFWRPDSMLSMPIPVEGGSLVNLRKLINVGDTSWALIVTFILFCFCPNVRTLHSNDEETTFEMARPQIITAIDALITRDDLADRAIMALLDPIEEEDRLPQAELNVNVEQARPGILGALLTALSQTLAEMPNTKPKRLPRMVD